MRDVACTHGGSQGLADIENNVAREMTKLGAVIQVPFRAGNQFLGEGGLQVSSLVWLSVYSNGQVRAVREYKRCERIGAISRPVWT